MACALRVGILGAGAIGGYLGVRLSASGVPVVLVGREGLVAAAGALQAVDLVGRGWRQGAGLVVTTDPAALAGVDVCLVTVKSSDTGAAARTLAPLLQPGTPVVSFQNGRRNVAVLLEGGNPGAVAGMVTFNVLREGPAGFRKATDGPLLAGKASGATGERLVALAAALAGAGEPLGLRDDMEAVLNGKLLLNLNNGLCAATGLSIAGSLREREVRRCFARCLGEGLRVVRAARLPVATIGKLPPALVQRLLPLPDALFLRLARRLIAVDPAARSSTLQDLDRGRATEIDHLNGEIVRLAEELGLQAPANAFVTAAVHRIEQGGLPPRFLSVAELKAGLEAAA